MKQGLMAFLRWMVPVILLACLGGFIVGYLVPQWIPAVQGGLCIGGVNCGSAHGVLITRKLPKPAANHQQIEPRLLTSLTHVRRGETITIEIQTMPGVVCAVSVGFFQSGRAMRVPLPVQFADEQGYCQTQLQLPQDAQVGKGHLRICANVCLKQEDFFAID
jgi:hypothetical protein